MKTLTCYDKNNIINIDTPAFIRMPIHSVAKIDKLIVRGRRRRADTQASSEVSIELKGGISLSGTLYPPANKATYPARGVILVHGFAAEKTENGLFPPLATALASKGVWVLAYDWRGLGSSQGDFQNTTVEMHVADFIGVLQWFSEHTPVAKSSLSAVGFSLGATIVELALRSGLSLQRAAYLSPAMRPALDMWPRYSGVSIWAEVQSRGFIVKNGVRVGREFLESLRDTDLAQDWRYDATVPLIVCHGTADERIPFSSSQRVFASKDSNIVKLVEFSGASHSFRPEDVHRPSLASLLSAWFTDASSQ
jgi:putative redox protein